MDDERTSSRPGPATERPTVESGLGASLERTAVVVTGMHESGTSALTRTLGLLGCGLPKTLVPAQEDDDDERGLPESRAVVDLNREILLSAGSTGNDWTPVNPEWKFSAVAAAFRERAQEVLADEFGDAPLFVLEDPRICRLLDFWLEALRDFGAAPHVVVPIRNPLEVASSIARRDRHEIPAVLLLWLRSVLDAEAMSRGVPRSFLRFDDLRGRWEPTVAKIGDDLGLQWPRQSATVGLEVESFPAPDERNVEERDAEVLDDPSLSPWLKAVFEIMARWARNDVRPTDREVLDEVRGSFDAATPAFDRLVTAGDEALRRERELDDVLEEHANEHARETAGLSERLRALEAEVRGKDAELEARASEIARLGQELAEAFEGRHTAEQRAAENAATVETLKRDLLATAAERDKLTRERASLLEWQNALSAEVTATAARRKAEVAKLEKRAARIRTLEHLLGKERARTERLGALDEQRREEARRQRSALRGLERELAAVRSSLSWRLTTPLRWPASLRRRLFAGRK